MPTERLAYHPPPESVRAQRAAEAATAFDAGLTLEALERQYILHILDQVEGHQSRAADRLGIDRRTLYRKLKQYRDEGVVLSAAI